MSYETDREQILNAIENMCGSYDYLCAAFAFQHEGDDLFNPGIEPAIVVAYLNHMGADKFRAFKWPMDHRGFEQRLLFLAFMLTWLDDYHGRQWDEEES